VAIKPYLAKDAVNYSAIDHFTCFALLRSATKKEAVFPISRDAVGTSQAQKPTLSLIDHVLIIKMSKSSSPRKRSQFGI
jgi:hypothetical protein